MQQEVINQKKQQGLFELALEEWFQLLKATIEYKMNKPMKIKKIKKI